MHPICSWMVTVDLVDDLTLTRLPAGSLSRYAILWHDDAPKRTEIDWSITSDLAVKAHLALERRVGRALPVQLKLQKRIPVGGGLGGGSSNAAAMLRGLNRLFELGQSPDALAQIGASLGSDVPFLVHGGSAIVRGFGAEIELLQPVPDLHVAMIIPAEQCPTGQVYRQFDSNPGAQLRQELVEALARSGGQRGSPFNDLAAPAVAVAPGMSALMRDIEEISQEPVHVSGSGSTLFVVARDASHAAGLAERIAAQTKRPALAARSIAAAP